MRKAHEYEQNIPIRNLYIYPNYAVLLPYREDYNRTKSLARLKNEKNLKNNQINGLMSAKACKRMTNAINWLVLSAKKKQIFDKKTNKRFSFRVNFITLTLPTTDHELSDNFVKKKMLHNFFATCQYKFGLNNYVWKAETQKNGNIHFHITSDTYMNHTELRLVWNKILSKHGLIQKYTSKHKKLSFEDYLRLYPATELVTVEQRKKAFDSGCAQNWSNPNTTDVHSVKNIRDIASYIVSYMGKKEADRRLIKGRVWGASYSLSSQKNIHCEVYLSGDEDIFKDLENKEIEKRVLELEDKATKKMIPFGIMYFYNLNQIGKDLKHGVFDLIQKRIFELRNPQAIAFN